MSTPEPLVNAKQVPSKTPSKRVARMKHMASQNRSQNSGTGSSVVYIHHHIFFHRLTSSTHSFFRTFRRAFLLTHCYHFRTSCLTQAFSLRVVIVKPDTRQASCLINNNYEHDRMCLMSIISCRVSLSLPSLSTAPPTLGGSLGQWKRSIMDKYKEGGEKGDVPFIGHSQQISLVVRSQ